MADNIPVFTIQETSYPEINNLHKLMHENVSWNISRDFLQSIYDSFEMKTFNAVAEDGEIIGTCSMSPIEDIPDCYMFTSFAVKKCYRGAGIGRELLEKADNIVRNSNALVNAAEGTDDLYNRKGYTLTDFIIHGVFDVPILNDEFKQNIKQDTAVIIEVTNGNDKIMEEVLNFDQRVAYSKRTQFVKSWCQKSEYTLVALRNNKCVGYTCLWYSEFYRVGPLFAEDNDVASLLWQKSVEKLSGEKILVEIFEENKDALSLFAKSGLTIERNKKYVNVRFNSKEIVKFNRKYVYALSSTDCPILV
ncbi:DgyrCDS4900 [Dimorphilus gyrociliatus]|uniref:DgyrCDS4900 n=1 Tax=Dimorphilus gyrociliatus TaxID=2664684 RepID=A0A7I8VKJ9_9ANNE|nr:DgyrCDS4900 [Dimorphilus gyrociliatus]